MQMHFNQRSHLSRFFQCTNLLHVAFCIIDRRNWKRLAKYSWNQHHNKTSTDCTLRSHLWDHTFTRMHNPLFQWQKNSGKFMVTCGWIFCVQWWRKLLEDKKLRIAFRGIQVRSSQDRVIPDKKDFPSIRFFLDLNMGTPIIAYSCFIICPIDPQKLALAKFALITHHWTHHKGRSRLRQRARVGPPRCTLIRGRVRMVDLMNEYTFFMRISD